MATASNIRVVSSEDAYEILKLEQQQGEKEKALVEAERERIINIIDCAIANGDSISDLEDLINYPDPTTPALDLIRKEARFDEAYLWRTCEQDPNAADQPHIRSCWDCQRILQITRNIFLEDNDAAEPKTT